MQARSSSRSSSAMRARASRSPKGELRPSAPEVNLRRHDDDRVLRGEVRRGANGQPVELRKELVGRAFKTAPFLARWDRVAWGRFLGENHGESFGNTEAPPFAGMGAFRVSGGSGRAPSAGLRKSAAGRLERVGVIDG
jgi:hypothetical protein